MDRAHLAQPVLLRVVACRRRQRRIMPLLAHTILSRHNSHPSLRRPNSRRHRLLIRRRKLSSLLNPPASLIPTTAHMLAPAVFRHLHLPHLLDWLDPRDNRLPDLSHRMGVQLALHPRCDLSWRTVLALLATDTRDHIKLSITLTHPPAVALQAAHLRQLLLLPLLRQLLEIARTARPLLRQNGIVSGKRARSSRATTRSAKSSRSLTAADPLPRTMHPRRKSRARAPRSLLMLDVSTMATTLRKLLIIHHH